MTENPFDTEASAKTVDFEIETPEEVLACVIIEGIRSSDI